MTETDITYLVGRLRGRVQPGAVRRPDPRPRWSAYSRIWERVAASILSLYVLAVLVGVGVAAGLPSLLLG